MLALRIPGRHSFNDVVDNVIKVKLPERHPTQFILALNQSSFPREIKFKLVRKVTSVK